MTLCDLVAASLSSLVALLQDYQPAATCRQDAGWGLLGGKKGLLFASFGALCAAVIEALPMVL